MNCSKSLDRVLLERFVSLVFHSSFDVVNWYYVLMQFVIYLAQVFLVRKITGHDANTLYAMKVLKKATLKGLSYVDVFVDDKTIMIVTRLI